MTYPETLEYLYSQLPAYHRIGKPAYKANLNNTLELDSYFGHPHRHFRTIHVAGTNGKGSVSHMLASVFQEAGYRTGLYTSPHLRDFRERIRINGEMISEEEVIAFVEKHEAAVRRIEPSFFEMTVAMAFDYFARMKVEVAVIEVGMGGRLDSTNIITPELSVITNIGHDHMEFLGRTLDLIAAEKAGIIKEGVPVVVGETQPETMPVFNTMAESRHALLIYADRQFICELGELDYLTGIRPWSLFSLTEKTRLAGTIPLGGLCQQKNIQTVVSAVSLAGSAFRLSNDHIVKGIEGVVRNTGLAGRWQILSHDPLTVCDTGHNKEGIEYAVRQLKAMRRRRLHMVIGFVNDKDLASLLPLLPPDAAYYFTRASVPRAMDENILRSEAAKYGLSGDSYPAVGEAVRVARKAAGKDDMIFIGGSTFVVGEVV